jgi:N-acetylneuraminic acid mutarotase
MSIRAPSFTHRHRHISRLRSIRSYSLILFAASLISILVANSSPIRMSAAALLNLPAGSHAAQSTWPFAWENRVAAPLSRFEANGTAVDGLLYVFGGFDAAIDAFNQTQVYNPATNQWTMKADMPEAITHAGIAVDENTIWLVGGYAGDDPGPSTTHVWKYNILSNTWSAGPALPAPRGAGAVALIGRNLHFFGGAVRTAGNHDDTDYGDHYVLNIDTATSWSQLADLPNPRNHLGGIALNGKIYAIGGQHDTFESTGNQTQVDVYDPGSDTWSQAASLPLGNGHISASTFVADGRIMVIGGTLNGGSNGLASDDVLLYDPPSNVWLKLRSLPDVRKTPVAGFINSQIVVATGGGMAGGPTNTTWVATLTNTWETGPWMWNSIGEVSGGIIGNWLYLVGESSPATLAYNLSTDTQSPPETLAQRPFPGNHHTAEVINGKLYLFGGLGSGQGKVQIFDPAANQWSLGADMPFAAGSSSSALIGGQVYVASGIVGFSTTNRLARYTPATNSWTELATMPQGRNHAAATTDGSKLYLFGGRGAGSGDGNTVANGFDTVQIYDPATNTWQSSLDPGSTLAPLPQARGGMGRAIYYNDEMYVLGGETLDGAGATANHVYDRVDIYNPNTNTWRLGTPMPTARHGIFPLLIGKRIYVGGGGTQAGYSNSGLLEIYNPGDILSAIVQQTPTPTAVPAPTAVPPPIRPPFVEQNGLAVMEAEHSHVAIERENQSWVPRSDRAGYLGESAMVAEPDYGTVMNTDYTIRSPEMQYQIAFTTLGTYYIWLRALPDNDNNNSAHSGLNGQGISSADRLSTTTYGGWTWFKSTLDGQDASMVVTSTGVNTLNLWMREDGFRLDRILITTDPNFTPTGDGPAESPPLTPTPIPTATATATATSSATEIPTATATSSATATATSSATEIPTATATSSATATATTTATPLTVMATTAVAPMHIVYLPLLTR